MQNFSLENNLNIRIFYRDKASQYHDNITGLYQGTRIGSIRKKTLRVRETKEWQGNMNIVVYLKQDFTY